MHINNCAMKITFRIMLEFYFLLLVFLRSQYIKRNSHFFPILACPTRIFCIQFQQTQRFPHTHTPPKNPALQPKHTTAWKQEEIIALRQIGLKSDSYDHLNRFCLLHKEIRFGGSDKYFLAYACNHG